MGSKRRARHRLSVSRKTEMASVESRLGKQPRCCSERSSESISRDICSSQDFTAQRWSTG